MLEDDILRFLSNCINDLFGLRLDFLYRSEDVR